MGWYSTGGGTDDDAIHDNVSGEIAAITEKTVPHDDDLLLIEDSEASNAKKRLKISNLPSGGGGGGGGGLELIEEITVSSSVASITFSSIPGSYDDLVLEMELETADAADQDRPVINVGNGSVDTGSNYAYVLHYRGSTNAENKSGNDTKMLGPVTLMGAGAVSGATGMSRMTFYRYAENDAWTSVQMWGFANGGDYYFQDGGGVWRSTAVIDTIQVAAEGGNLEGGRARLYGRSRG